MYESHVLPRPCSNQELETEIARLNKIIQALMRRVERNMGSDDSDFSVFQTAVMLDDAVQIRTRELETALQSNERITRKLKHTQGKMEQEILERKQVQQMLEDEHGKQAALIARLEDAQVQVVQAERLASIGQLAAGVAHEINNPIGFVNSNLSTLNGYFHNLLELLDAYVAAESHIPADSELRARIDNAKVKADFDYLKEDVGALIAESIDGTGRVRRIVQGLRDFSRVGDAEWESADIHAGLDSTLNVVWNEIKYKADVIKEYGDLPRVECLPSQLNQVVMNLLVNAAQAMPEHGEIHLRTGREGERIWIQVADNGQGIPAALLPRIFDPFFTTKPVGAGTGLGLSVSYGIVQKLGGQIYVASTEGKGTTFTIWLPIHRAHPSSPPPDAP